MKVEIESYYQNKGCFLSQKEEADGIDSKSKMKDYLSEHPTGSFHKLLSEETNRYI